MTSIKEYSRNLKNITHPRYIGNYLDTRSKQILLESAGKILISKIKKRKGPAEWKFSISRTHPLRFIESDLGGVKVQIDISCRIEGIGIDINSYNILMRIWSCNEDICYRDDLDAIGLKKKLEDAKWKRVMLRFHIDKRNPAVEFPEPLYHLQIGGDPEDCEYCWIPKQIKLPRFPYPPMDLILLCEFVLVNFFPKKSENLRKDPEWQSIVRKSQEIFLKKYFENMQRYLKSHETETLLGNLVNLKASV